MASEKKIKQARGSNKMKDDELTDMAVEERGTNVGSGDIEAIVRRVIRAEIEVLRTDMTKLLSDKISSVEKRVAQLERCTAADVEALKQENLVLHARLDALDNYSRG